MNASENKCKYFKTFVHYVFIVIDVDFIQMNTFFVYFFSLFDIKINKYVIIILIDLIFEMVTLLNWTLKERHKIYSLDTIQVLEGRIHVTSLDREIISACKMWYLSMLQKQ